MIKLIRIFASWMYKKLYSYEYFYIQSDLQGFIRYDCYYDAISVFNGLVENDSYGGHIELWASSKYSIRNKKLLSIRL